ncbi:MAG TPA: efflux RND transporter periplasmic adaptor subunit [Burkholderiales bacterium]|jgi:HlyD family secretion protein|nr:efflux RND transporter periplasmic adaptor subunit [Burkholderiales bacterium]
MREGSPLLERLHLRGWRLGAAIGALLLLAFGVARFAFGPSVEVFKVVRRDVVQTVVASGRVETPYRVDIGSQVVGTVAQVPVEKGDRVKAGQTLIVLEASEAQALVKQAELAVTQAEARLRQLRELQLPVANQSLRQAQANLENAQVTYERNKRLYESGFIGRSVLDESQRALDVAHTQVDTARKQVETARPAGSDTAMANAALAQAQASLQAARARLAYATITAPRDGTLIARDVERGDVVQPGKALMVLSPEGETQLVLQIDERNLGRLKVGQPALASADAYPNERFKAEVVYINPGVDAQRGTVEVKLRVPDPPAYLRQDMTVSVDIEVERHAGALALRTEGVRELGSASPWVLKVNGGFAHRQNVTLGLRGEGWTEIRAGLSEGDLVVPADNTEVKPGRRVRTAIHE